MAVKGTWEHAIHSNEHWNEQQIEYRRNRVQHLATREVLSILCCFIINIKQYDTVYNI